MKIRKLLSIVLALAIVLSMVPGTVFAQTDDQMQEASNAVPVEEVGASMEVTEPETEPETELQPEEPEHSHTHCVCGGSAVNIHQHLCEDVQWRPLSEVVTLTAVNWKNVPSGNYYLDGDVTVTAVTDNNAIGHITKNSDGTYTLTEARTVSLCLNGYNITTTKDRTFRGVYMNSVLNISDCSGKKESGVWKWGGTIVGGTSANGGICYTYANSEINIYGGNLTGLADYQATGDGGLFYIAQDRSVIGTSGTSSQEYGSTVNIYNGNLYGGNTAKTGGNIRVSHCSNLHVYGGYIHDGTAGTYGDNIYFASKGTCVLENAYIYNGTIATKSGITVNTDNIFDTDPNGASEVVGGTCTEHITWSIDTDMVLYITGEGQMADYTDATQVPWYSYASTIKRAVLSSEITHIGAYAFADCKAMAFPELPTNLTSIGDYAFVNCQAITSVTLPNNILSVGQGAFSNCTCITTIVLSKSMTEICPQTFTKACVISLIIPGNIKTIGEGAFADCPLLLDLTIEEGVEEIGAEAFSECSNLKDVSVPKGLKAVGEAAFYNCNSLTRLDFDTGLETIGDSAFYNCTDLTLAALPEGLKSIGDSAFYKCAGLTLAALPEGLKSIGDSAFYNCAGLTLTTLPEGLETIGKSAFYNCDGITKITIPAGVTTIVANVFSGCDGLKYLFISSTVTSLDRSAFESCSGLAELIVDPQNQYYSTDDSCVLYNRDKTVLLWVPLQLRNVRIPEGVVKIEQGAFLSCNCRTVSFPESLREIGSKAFYNCYYLDKVFLNEGLETIEEYAFYSCDSLTTVYIPGSVKSISDRVFHYCDGLRTVSFNEGLEYIGEYTFSNCDSLTSIHIPSSVKTIGPDAFYSCDNLTQVLLNEGLENIEAGVFSDCDSLISIDIPDSVKSIGFGAFSSCEKLEQVSIGTGVEAIKINTFYNCDSLSSINIPGSVKSIDDGAFYDCDKLERVSIGEGLERIESRAFDSCNAIASISFPSTLKYIGKNAFVNCSNLISVAIPDGTTVIEESAFSSCWELQFVRLPSSLTQLNYSFAGIPVRAVFFNGTSSQWEALPKNTKDPLTETKVICIDDTQTPKPLISQLTIINQPDSTRFAVNSTPDLTGLVLQAIYTDGSSVLVSDGYVLGRFYNDEPRTQTIAVGYDGAHILLEFVCKEPGEDQPLTGSCGEGLTWTFFPEGKLVITGEGAMENYTAETVPWHNLADYITSVVIEDGVTTIGSNAFGNCAALVTVQLPASLTTICEGAFADCTALEYLYIPRFVTQISPAASIGPAKFVVDPNNEAYSSDEHGVLYNKEKTKLLCAPTYLQNYVIPDTVTVIGAFAFAYNGSLVELTIPEQVVEIGTMAFTACPYLSKVHTGGELRIIDVGAFMLCPALLEADIGNGLVTLGVGTFMGCASLTTLTIPYTVTALGDRTVYGCESLTDVYFDRTEAEMVEFDCGGIYNAIYLNIATIHYAQQPKQTVAKGRCGEGLSWELKENGYLLITGIGAMYDFEPEASPWYAYKDQIQFVRLNYGVASIGAYSFYGCHCITDIVASGLVKRIGASATEGCTKLKFAYYEGAIQKLNIEDGNNAFSAVLRHDDITVTAQGTHGDIQWELDSKGVLTFSGIGVVKGTYYDYGEGDEYNEVEVVAPWLSYRDSITEVVVEEGITGIGAEVFYVEDDGLSFFRDSYSSITRVYLADSVTSIGVRAFEYAGSNMCIYMGSGISSIASNAFSGASISSVYYYGTYEQSRDISIATGNEKLGNAIWHYCVGQPREFLRVDMVSPPENQQYLVGQALSTYGMKLIAVYSDGYTENVTDKATFTGFDSSKAGVITVEITCMDYSFNIELEILPDCGSCGDNLQWKCENNVLTISGSGQMYDYSSDQDVPWKHYDSYISQLVLEEGVTHIGDSVFEGCSSLTSITIPDSVTSIGDSAFYNCSSLTSIYLGKNLAQIGLFAFPTNMQLQIRLSEDNPHMFLDEYGVLYTRDRTTLLFAPSGLTGTYTILDGVTEIREYAFYACMLLSGVKLPDTVQTIGYGAFTYCITLSLINFPQSLTYIGDMAFALCVVLPSAPLPPNIAEIPSGVFAGCAHLAVVKLPGNLTKIGPEAFIGCEMMHMVFVPETVQSIDPTAFAPETILLVYEGSYAHSFAYENKLKHRFVRNTGNPNVAYGTQLSGRVTYDDGTGVANAKVELLYSDGVLLDQVTTDSNGRYTFPYVEVGTYTLFATDADGNASSEKISIYVQNEIDIFLSGNVNLKLKKGWNVTGTVSENGATVTISDLQGNILGAVEAADGSFSLSNIPNGSYILKAQTDQGSVVQEINIFGSNLEGVVLELPERTSTVWGLVSVENRDGTLEHRNWVTVTLYDKDGVAVSQTKTDEEGKYSFANMPLGSYRLVAQTEQFRPDHHGRPFERSYTLTGYAYADASEAGTYRMDIVMREVHDREADFSGKVTAHGNTQNCDVIVRDVDGNEYARYITGKNGKYSFVNIPGGVYIITAISSSNGMGYTVITVRDGQVYGDTDIVIYKDGKLTQQEIDFYADLGQCNTPQSAKNLRSRIAQEKRLYDSLSEKEKKQLSKEYVESLNRLVEWVVDCAYMTPEGVILGGGGTVVSGQELENKDTVTFNLSIEKIELSQVSEDGVKNADDYIYYDILDTAGERQIQQYYEITMTKIVDGEATTITSVSKDTDATGKFRITMPIPEEYRGYNNYTMLHVHNGETVVLTDLDDDPDTITFEVDAFSTFALTVSDEIVIPVTNTQLWQGTELYGNYATVEDAFEQYDHTTQYVKLTGDAQAQLSLTQDLYIDLAGYNLSGRIITNGFKVYGMDSTTNTYSCSSAGTFSCVDENGNAIVPERHFKSNITGTINRYMAIAAEEGYTFHRFYLGITKVSVRPGETGFGYKAVFYGDEMVLAQLDSFGFTMNLSGSTVELTRMMNASELVMGREYSLLLRNYDVEHFGTADVNAEMILKLKDGTVIHSGKVSYSMMTMLRQLCQNMDILSNDQLRALRAMCLPFKAVMSSWGVDALFADK